MAGFRSTKQLISFSLRTKSIISSSKERHSPAVSHRHLHRLAPRTPRTNNIDRHRRASALSHPTTMAVGLLPPRSCQSVDTKRAQFKPDQFRGLVQTLKDALGPSSGLDSGDVDLDALKDAMKEYKTEQGGWERYDFTDSEYAYTRNLVDEGNGKSNLLILVWTPGKGSPIHDHGNAHCVMKILRGELTETRYAFPEGDQEQPMKKTKISTYRADQVAYMADELGLHTIENRGADYAVSLHLYTPPNVAKSGCHVFDPLTSVRRHMPSNGGGYYSKFGKKL